ncbi:MAG: hypothetical protein GXP25_24490 [Planctomycetes bacterium]|nr:hypothetical protein [Planctomycetota bacterium]
METLFFKETARGLGLTCGGRKLRLDYPDKIWRAYPRAAKAVLVDNLAHVLTINMPLVSGAETVRYNTAVPVFKPAYDSMVIEGIPGSVEPYPEDTAEVIRRFLNINYIFESNDAKHPVWKSKGSERAVVATSCGKDSLLSLAVCHELGLDPVPVYINDTVSPTENRIKQKFLKKLTKEFGFECHIVTNAIEQINDFETWGKDETCLGYMHMMTGFALILLPFAHYYKARYIVLGNQQNMNFGFLNKDGYWTWPSFDQTHYWTKRQDTMVRVLTGGATHVVSVIEPLTNIAIMRVLMHEYPDFAKYLVSCDCLDASAESRWCHNCSKCARMQMLIRAAGSDIREVGFSEDMIEKKHRKFYCLFDGSEVDNYERSAESRDEQLLAFFMAWQNGASGPLMIEFEKDFLAEAMEREEELQKRFFTFYHPFAIPDKLRKRVLNFYEREFLQ